MRISKIVFLVSLLALVVVPSAWAIRFTDDSYVTPVGQTGQAYSHQFKGEGGCGPALPYQYRILAGGLPPGLSLSKSGLISGVPAQTGDYNFWVELSDENPPSQSWCVPKTAEREFSIRILQGMKIQQNAVATPAILNEPYSFQLTVTGASAPTWSIQSGTLPTGITLNAFNGLLSGTPTAAGDYTFSVKVAEGSRSTSETYTIRAVEKLQITEPAARAAEVDVPFRLQLNATGGRGTHTWALAGNTTLPEGLTLDAATGLISGEPESAGRFTTKLAATDTVGQTSTVDVTFAVSARLLAVKKPLPLAKVGKAYLGRLAKSGGVGPWRWNILGGLPGVVPPGLKFNAKTGVFAGKPTKAGVYRLRMQVVDKLKVKSAIAIVLKVNP